MKVEGRYSVYLYKILSGAEPKIKIPNETSSILVIASAKYAILLSLSHESSKTRET